MVHMPLTPDIKGEILSLVDGLESIFELPADRPLGGTPAVAAATHRITPALPAQSTAPAVAAWLTALSRYADSSDFMLGVLLDASESSLHRVRLAPNTTFGELTAWVEAELLPDARSYNQHELLAFGGDTVNDRHPIYQVAVSHNEQRNAGSGEGCAPCDAVLELTSDNELGLRYRVDRYTQHWAESLLAHTEQLLRGGTATPDATLDSLAMTTEHERATLSAWGLGPDLSTTAPSIYSMFAEQVVRTPHAVAVEFNGESLSFEELDRRAQALSEELVAAGVTDDVRVAISVERSPALLVAMLAVLGAGGTYVPVDPAYPEARRAMMLADSGAWATLSGPASDGSVVVSLTSPSDQRERVQADPNLGRLGYVIYTSGSTGKPKGVALGERALVNLLTWQRDRQGFAPMSRTLQFTSLSFDVSFQEIMSTLITGGTVVLVDDTLRRDPSALLRYIDEHRIERVFMPFVALRGLAHAARETKVVPKNLREVYTAGEQLQVDDDLRAFFRALPDCRLENQYGPSESHVVTAYTLPRDRATWEALPSIGSPIANSQVAVLNAGHQLQPVGVPGELYLGGTCLAHGYLDNPELTDEKFVTVHLPDGPTRMYRTGDIVSWRPDGNLQYHHRVDNQLKLRGYRIELGEVSVVLSNHPAVTQAVAAVRTVGEVPKLVAFVVGAEDLDLRDVRRHAAEQLPPHMVPSLFSVVPGLPLTASGKIDVDALETPKFDRSLLSTPYERAADGVEADFWYLFTRALKLPDIGRNDDWFELGGDSLTAVELFAEIKAHLHVDLPLGALAANPTIKGMADYYENNRDNFSVLVPIRATGTRTPFFVVHGGSGNVASFPKLARQLPDDQPLYGVQWDGLKGLDGSKTIIAMATRYLVDIRSVQPKGPYVLGGQCTGGLVALEMSKQLLAQGEKVDLLVMYDSPNLSSTAYVPRPRKETLKIKVYLQKLNVERFASEIKAGVSQASSMTGRAGSVLDAVKAKAWTNKMIKPRGFGDVVGDFLLKAVLGHTVTRVNVPTIFFTSGLKNGEPISLTGGWTDDALGFSEFAGPNFKIIKATGGHNDMLYGEIAVDAVRRALEAVHAGKNPLTA